MASEKMKARIDKWLAKDYRYTFYERITLLFESEHLFEHLPYAERYGKTLAYILGRMTVPIEEEDLLVGRVFEKVPSRDEWEYVESVYKSWWADRTPEEIQKDILWFYSRSWLRCRPPWFYSFGHLALDWEKLLSEGLQGFITTAEASKRTKSAEDEISFLNGAVTCIRAISQYIERYAQEAQRVGRYEQSESLKHISLGAPRTFKEALQLLWLLTIVIQKVCGCGVLNYSRMDKYLQRFYEEDIKNGRMTEEEALESIEDFFFKNNEIMANTDHMSLDTESTADTLEVAFDDPNYIILAGLNADGTSAVNAVSRLLVKAAANLRLKNPFIVVRYHKGIAPDFWQQACTAMRDNATIVIYNDETMIPALKRYGVEEPEVYDYGFFGCNDPNIPACDGGLRQLWFNLVKPLELVLNQGDFPMEPQEASERRECQYSLEDRMIGIMNGAYYGVKTPALSQLDTMDKLMKAYETQLKFLLHDYRRGIEKDMQVEAAANKGRLRIEDCFLKGTLENAVTWNNGGTKYHKIVVQGSGIATVTDALYAIEKLVYADKQYSLEQLNQILKANWESDKLLQQRARRIEKFGNDIDSVDQYAREVTVIFTDAVLNENGGNYLYSFFPTLSTDRDFTTMGKAVGATADGRSRQEALSENQSPAQGADINGITALLNSVAKIPFDRITGGPLNLRLHPSAVAGEAGEKIIAALLKTYMDKGGLQVQINVVDKETFLAAKEDPSKYRNLCVRVTGYSAFFTQMGEKAQSELIKRTEQMS